MIKRHNCQTHTQHHQHLIPSTNNYLHPSGYHYRIYKYT